ncbi:predicted protein [Uncinocarpus reesii 1704]|uniref:Rab-GAP TBC domain-containing protein n=1 Tax=Uncinocarpus reesii (strain UAMH 1704) TaxID=336963 RepID=C4JK41_UNCRE|nr:uncharacterized protein UREG_01998 [Uncinocarpus reesii 1704]EEP77149.1 predicted protein [Uncinocarpus reesii 1704]
MSPLLEKRSTQRSKPLQSPWQTLRQDETIRAEIYQDVERCLQENYFFREPTTKRMMLDILFIFVKLNPDLGYRQGMHELLAPVLWVIWQDAVAKDALTNHSPSSVDDQLLLQTLDSDYIEHDAFAIFCAIMQTAMLFYEHNEMKSGSDQQTVSSIIVRSQHIHQIMLGSVDPELAAHLQSIEILPQIYLTAGLCFDAAKNQMAIYPSPEPQKPADFLRDALFLEENMTLDGGELLISKYSGKSPDFKGHRLQFQGAQTASQKRNSQSRDISSRASGRTSPSRSPLRINQKRLDSLFQDVSDGIYRRTEGWGVARVVRGAMVEARRNIQGIHSSPTTPTLRPEGGSTPRLSIPSRVEAVASRELSLKIISLENRNKALASMLGDALKDLQVHEPEPKGAESNTSTGNMDQIREKIERVRELLQDSSIPIPEKVKDMTINRNDGRVMKSRPAEKRNQTLTSKTEPLGGAESSSSSSSSLPLNAKNSQTDNLLNPMPIRPAPRASLAESSFSWMLGEKENRSAFAPCASAPPEHLRKSESRTRAAPLFRDQRSDDKRRRTDEADNDVLVLERLPGISKE